MHSVKQQLQRQNGVRRSESRTLDGDLLELLLWRGELSLDSAVFRGICYSFVDSGDEDDGPVSHSSAALFAD
jgi:hypothetical protein